MLPLGRKYLCSTLRLHSTIVLYQTSRDMHRSAITGLVIQAVAVTSSTVVPMFMLCHILLLPPSSATFISHYATCSTLLFSLKSFNSSISMILTTKPYREHFATVTGLNFILSRYSVGKVLPKIKEPTLVSSSAVVNSNNQL
ncbi:unnamed protein product [Cylicocyclus nassatus]|uniref:Uncharacterized protein n=1 Tax=Cylicocyclus nassatus TaxID=53992 RepID=A0AA36GZA4_CYLNA|nr:unnamed protein product [Cylicocyclus nassatus]